MSFAVVANEVKKLSGKTSDIVQSVEKVLVKIESSSHGVESNMSKALAQSFKNTELLDTFNNHLVETRRNNGVAITNVAKNSDRIFITLAKLDHVIWKINTYLSVLQRKPAFNYVDHHGCRLGKWYDSGDGRENFSGASSYGQLPDPHAKVHSGTKAILEMLEAGKFNLRFIVKSIEEMESGSDGVFRVLDRILSDTH